MIQDFLLNIENIHMWFTLGIIGLAIILYTIDRIPLEITSVLIFSALLLFFYLLPLTGERGEVLIDTRTLFSGFANPALLAVISLLVVGQAVVQTGALNEIANIIVKMSRNHAFFSISISLLVVTIISAMLNNTPVVVIFIPILAAVAKHYDISVSKMMIPLSYSAILGGMTTLIGSSTNLLVSGTMQGMGLVPLGFFDFTIPGLVLASVGFIYILFVAPKLLPDRASMAKQMVGTGEERKFIAQIEVDRHADFAGKTLEENAFPGYPNISVRMIQRGEHAYLPPFEEHMTLQPLDLVIVSANRQDIADLLSRQPNAILQNTPGAAQVTDADEETNAVGSNVSMAEVIISPSSRMIGRNLEEIGFHHQHHCLVLGIQRQSRIIRSRLTEIRLAAGDVLLVMGKQQDIFSLQDSNDMLLLEWSTQEIHSGKKATSASIILAGVVGVAALDIVPIAISAFVGATAALLSGCLNLRQARRSIDSQIVLIVATSLALGTAMQATGGAQYIAKTIIDLFSGASPTTLMSVLFLLMVILTNILSNNASAVLFTPIAVGMAQQLGVSNLMFVTAVILACNCSFITPIGYQTNLLVMGPGHHKFSDFIRSGLPLALLMWITYTLFAPWYFGL